MQNGLVMLSWSRNCHFHRVAPRITRMWHVMWFPHISHDISIKGCKLSKWEICLPFMSTRVHSRFFGGVRVAHHFSLPCMHGVFAFCFVFVLCLVCPILPMFRDCPFLIALSDFSNVSFPASSIQHICSENYAYQNKWKLYTTITPEDIGMHKVFKLIKQYILKGIQVLLKDLTNLFNSEIFNQ